jgi:O-antigen ligase
MFFLTVGYGFYVRQPPLIRLENYVRHYDRLFEEIEVMDKSGLHNLYVNIAIDVGMIGLGLSLCFVGSLLIGLYKSAAHTSNERLRLYLFANLISFVGFLVNMLQGGNFVLKFWFFIMGLSIVGILLVQKSSQKDPPPVKT